jgi:flagellar basal-body rod protein FlgC
MINAIGIALSGLQAASRKVEASASNIANMQTADYEPLTTQQTAQTDNSGNGQGVKSDFVPKTQPFTPSYDPDSPFANNEGYVNTPNVDLAEEAVNMTIASTAYKASVSVIETVQDMTKEMLQAFDKKA